MYQQQQQPPLTNAERLRMEFQRLSARRDEPVVSETKVRGYDTTDGYVQEVVSTSPRVSRTASNEDIQLVTTRKSTTKGGSGPNVTTAPSFKLETIQVVTPRDHALDSESVASSSSRNYTTAAASSPTPIAPLAPAAVASLRPLPPGYIPPLTSDFGAGGSTRSASAASASSDVSGRRITGVSPAGPRAKWVRQVETYDAVSMASTDDQPPSRRSVSYGNTETCYIEPSRISPLHDIGVYAPVRYISKRELRRRRQQEVTGRSLESRIRSGSVPRLDSEREHGGRAFAANGGVRAASREPRVAEEDDEDVYYEEHESQHYARQSRGRNEEPRYFAAERRSTTPLRSLSGGAGGGGSAPRYATPTRMAQMSPPPAVRYVRAPPVTTSDMLPDGHTTIEEVGRHLAYARNTTAPPPPPYADAAFRLLHRGTYLVKYGRGGNPHERWLTIRMVTDEESGQTGPYLLWSIHDGAVSFKEKLHLSHLLEVRPGAGSPSFSRQMATPDMVMGPFVGGQRSYLPVKHAFTLVFRSRTAVRSVDVLALDEQTYACWILVCSYLAGINSGAAETIPAGAETLAPDTPRSMSQGSQR